MTRVTTLAWVLTLGLLAGCGEPPRHSPAKHEAEVKTKRRVVAEITRMFGMVTAKDRAGLAPFIAYRGNDKARKWKDGSNYDAADEKSRVDQVFSKIEFLMMSGSPTFEEFESETESEGTWLVWHIGFGNKRAAFACLEVDGKIILGDID